MTLKRLANTISAVAATVLVVGGIVFAIGARQDASNAPDGDRILSVRLPTEAAGANEANYYLLDIDENGNFVENGAILDHDKVLQNLKKLARIQEDVPFRIRGADKTSWDSMIRAVDLVESAGLTNVKFSTPKHESR